MAILGRRLLGKQDSNASSIDIPKKKKKKKSKKKKGKHSSSTGSSESLNSSSSSSSVTSSWLLKTFGKKKDKKEKKDVKTKTDKKDKDKKEKKSEDKKDKKDKKRDRPSHNASGPTLPVVGSSSSASTGAVSDASWANIDTKTEVSGVNRSKLLMELKIWGEFSGAQLVDVEWVTDAASKANRSVLVGAATKRSLSTVGSKAMLMSRIVEYTVQQQQSEKPGTDSKLLKIG